MTKCICWPNPHERSDPYLLPSRVYVTLGAAWMRALGLGWRGRGWEGKDRKVLANSEALFSSSQKRSVRCEWYQFSIVNSVSCTEVLSYLSRRYLTRTLQFTTSMGKSLRLREESEGASFTFHFIFVACVCSWRCKTTCRVKHCAKKRLRSRKYSRWLSLFAKDTEFTGTCRFVQVFTCVHE